MTLLAILLGICFLGILFSIGFRLAVSSILSSIIGFWASLGFVLLKIILEPQCRRECERLAWELAEIAKLRTGLLMSQGVAVTIGAYGAYIRFSVPAEIQAAVSS